jgi:hypothetical protein
MKTIFGLQAVHKQVASQIWPAGQKFYDLD